MNFFHFIFQKDHFLITILAVFLMLLLTVITFTIPIFNPVVKALKNISAMDLFFQIENKMDVAEVCQDVVIVDMTELHSRSDIGQLLSDIYDARPKAIGVDLIFEGEKDNIEEDLVLEKVVEKIAPITIFANKLVDYDVSEKKFRGCVMSYFRDLYSIEEGYTNLNDNMEHAVIRNTTISQVTIFGKQLSFPVKLAIKSGMKHIEHDGSVIIDFRPVRIPVLSFDQIKKKQNLLKGKVVLVGTMKEERDCFLSPLGKMPGIELQAYSLLTLMKHTSIAQLSKYVSILIAIVLCYVYELFLDAVAIFVRTRKLRMRIFLSESRILLTFLPMLFFSSVTMMAFLIFDIWSTSVDLVIILVMLSMVAFSRRLYWAFKKMLESNK